MNNRRVFLVLGIIMSVIFSFGTISLAVGEVIPEKLTVESYDFMIPMWNDDMRPELVLNLNGGNVACIGYLRGNSGTTKIDATFRLEKKGWFGWSEVNSWNRTSYSDYLSFSGSAGAESGATYRFSVVAAVTRNGRTETVSSSVEGRN